MPKVLFFVVALTLAFASSAVAQVEISPNTQVIKDIPEGLVSESLAKGVGIDPKSPEMEWVNRFVKGQQKGAQPSKNEIQSRKLYRHHYGKEGIPFPSEETIDARLQEQHRFVQKQKSEIGEINYDEVQDKIYRELLDQYSHPQPLPLCPDQIRQTPIPNFRPEGESVDFLVADELPEGNQAEFFGSQATVIRYRSASDDVMSGLAYSWGVRCVPMRVRYTNGNVVTYLGKPALMNYDNEKGKFHPAVEKWLTEKGGSL